MFNEQSDICDALSLQTLTSVGRSRGGEVPGARWGGPPVGRSPGGEVPQRGADICDALSLQT
jgi:hypothetical protein